MDFNNNNIKELFKIREKLILEGSNLDAINNEISKLEMEYSNSLLSEDTSATGSPSGSVSGGEVSSTGVGYSNASIGGMGAIISSQPSSNAGTTIGTDFVSGGGILGSGDIGVPYNATNKKKMFQKLEMGKNHGARTGKKTREKKLDLKSIKNTFAKKNDIKSVQKPEKSKKIMNFNDFKVDDVNKVKKVDDFKSFESLSMNIDNCERCNLPTNGTTIMSVFNKDIICMECKELEKKDPKYKLALDSEIEQIKKGNYNYEGLYPDYKNKSNY